MSIRHLNPEKSKWVIDYYPAGKKGERHQIRFNGSEANARAYEAELRRQHASEIINPVNPKIIDIVPEYLEWLKIHRAKATYVDVKKSMKFILAHFGHMTVPRITEAVITQYKQLREGKPRATNKDLDYLQSIISYMVKHEYANKLPFKIEKVPYKRPIPQIPHPSDIEKFLEEIKEPIKKAFVLLLFETGLRFSDASGIKWEDIDWTSGTLHIIQKGGHPRLVVLTDNIRRILEPLKNSCGTGEYIFKNPRTGNPYLSLKTLFRNASRRANVKRIRPHLLRHAGGTYLLEATGDLRLTQTFLGHKDIASTQIYTHIATNRLKEGMEKAAHHIGEMRRRQRDKDKGPDE